jgi:DNA-binding CsgD family transcriptional regulator
MGGAAPRSRQLHRTLGLLRGIRHKPELVSVGLPAVCALVGAEIIGFNSWGPGGVSARPGGVLPHDALHRADLTAYALFREQQPLIDFYRRRTAVLSFDEVVATLSGPFRTSDVASLREFWRTDLYHHFYQPLAVKYQLGLAVAEEDGWATGYAFSRGSPDFDDQAFDLMAVAGRALTSAHHRVTAQALRGRFESLSCALLDDDRSRNCCLVMIDERGRADIATGPLLPRVAAKFGTIAPGSLAPAALARLATASRASFRVRVALGDGDIADATSVPAPEGGGSVLFELRDPTDLRARYGLTAGEYQTLANIARLETNERAAQAEGVSVPTIEKRMSSIISKMHVETRVGAVREYLRHKPVTHSAESLAINARLPVHGLKHPN